ncbi:MULTISPECIES: GNAT family N-acetyltransferase [unclassified Microcoleus]|uniref:GNAT family N-acetyltransferase n=1 Tax=unclassified Microcoleus TaxID=2642155 RepID=UPI002FD52438
MSKRKTLYGGYSGKNNPEDSLLDPDSDSAKIRAFFVHPAWARRGIGSQIMRVCELAAERAGFKEVEMIAREHLIFVKILLLAPSFLWLLPSSSFLLPPASKLQFLAWPQR